MKRLPLGAKLYVVLVCLLGAACVVAAWPQWRSENLVRFVLYLAFVAITSRLKVVLPGIQGNLSLNYIFILLSVIDLNLPQTLLICLAGALTQSFLHAKARPKLVQTVFNLCDVVVCSTLCHMAYRSPWLRSLDDSTPIMLFWCSLVYFATNTLSISLIITFSERKPVAKVWFENFFWTAPHYLIGAGLAGLIQTSNRLFGWQYAVLVVPGIYLVYRSYHLYLGRLEVEKKHVTEMADLHLRTIEALALAIEAKDDTTHSHLRRVQVYAKEIAVELGLPEEQVYALEAAALLHDIGKLAVPEYIIAKPGRLTPEEFDRMKIHPIVGAEILECVRFPYPVVPIVRSHHEKWNGTGYPDGLSGEAIPIGARVLSAVDCLDAMASDRQYRPAIPLERALEYVCSESGKSFDPKVVDILQRRCLEMEAKVRIAAIGSPRLSTKTRVTRGDGPAAGLEVTLGRGGPRRVENQMAFISYIASARQEFQTLHEVTRDLGTSLSVEDTLSLLAVRLRDLVPFHAISIYKVRGDTLVPQFVSGEDSHLFSSLAFSLGQGVSGWVAENKRPIINGVPSVEPGYLADPSSGALLSAISVPLEGLAGVIGVLTLYHRDADAFTNDHLRILLAISSKAGLTIENAMQFRQVQETAATDQLTGLANTHSLFVHLDSELNRCKRTGTTLAVMVLDLDGFKAVNDRFGHLLGNKVLQATADGLKKTCRHYDYVARMGGDEFVVVIPGLGPEHAQARVRAFEEVVREAGRQACGSDILSLSTGEAFYPVDGTDAEQLLAAADKRMYQMKQAHHLYRGPEAVREPWPEVSSTVQ